MRSPQPGRVRRCCGSSMPQPAPCWTLGWLVWRRRGGGPVLPGSHRQRVRSRGPGLPLDRQLLQRARPGRVPAHRKVKPLGTASATSPTTTAAAAALRRQVTHSPHRKPARALPMLGGEEPANQGDRDAPHRWPRGGSWWLVSLVDRFGHHRPTGGDREHLRERAGGRAQGLPSGPRAEPRPANVVPAVNAAGSLRSVVPKRLCPRYEPTWRRPSPPPSGQWDRRPRPALGDCGADVAAPGCRWMAQHLGAGARATSVNCQIDQASARGNAAETSSINLGLNHGGAG